MTQEKEAIRDKRPYLVLLLPLGFISNQASSLLLLLRPRVFTIFTVGGQGPCPDNYSKSIDIISLSSFTMKIQFFGTIILGRVFC